MSGPMQYKCPRCGGGIVFDSALQKVKCPFCGSEFEPEALADYDRLLQMSDEDRMEWDSAGQVWQEADQEGMRVYVCSSCGGSIVTDAVTAASSCPYCDNPVVMTGQLAGSLKPDLVLPFRLDKKAAVAGLASHMKGKRLLPKVFKDENHIREVKGIYVPFWLYDADADGSFAYEATKVREWEDRDYRHRETSHYAVARQAAVSFADVPVDGSGKMPDSLMESLEPYDLSQAVPFQTAYLAGYLADRYDRTEEECAERANERVRTSTAEAIRDTVTGYTSVTEQSGSVTLTNGKAKYALLPVWLLNTEWNGTKYTFAMNGQTGKFVGDLPLDRKAYAAWLIGLGLGIAAVLALLFILLGMNGC